MRGVLLGGAITLLVALVFHLWSGRGLRKQTNRLETLITMIQGNLEDHGFDKAVREKWRLTGGRHQTREITDPEQVTDSKVVEESLRIHQLCTIIDKIRETFQ